MAIDQAVLQKWDYHVEELTSHDKIGSILTTLGSEGWELVSVTGGNSPDTSAAKTLRRKQDSMRAFFKRPAD